MVDKTKTNDLPGFTENPVLIVEDSKQYATVLQKMLANGFGFKNITHVESVEAATELLKADPNHFKVLFVDYNFPSGVTGGELLQKLKDTNQMSGKITFLMTSEPTPDNVKQAVMAGAFGIVAKPFDRNELTKQLEKAQRAIDTEKIESF